MKSFLHYLATFLFLSLLVFSCTPKKELQIGVSFNQESPQLQFAIDKLKDFSQQHHFDIEKIPLNDLGITENPAIVFVNLRENMPASLQPLIPAIDTGGIKPEGFRVINKLDDQRILWILGIDEAGLMYGGIELSELLINTDINDIADIQKNPYIAMRGTKFNLPLDARTPTYTEPSDAVQKNMPEMWDFSFWKEYIDLLALYRYNFVSLWSLHPFPSMVRVPEYPDIALDDVKQFQGSWKEYYSTRTTDFGTEDIINHLTTIKEISIDEKIDFWREVMAYGKQRNVDFFIITWNIYTYGVDGKYGIDSRIDNEITRDYYRKSVKAMYDTYPDLAGIGLTTGEQMDASSAEKEDWVWETYGLGTLDAALEQPQRKFIFVHRQHEAGAQEIVKKFSPLLDHPNIEFIFSFKYAKAHVYSSTTQNFHHEYVEDIKGMKTWWTLRNDDVYHFRWAAPDFVRDFIRNIPYDVTRGFYLGSDQYVWGREFLDKHPERPRELELTKHWLHWLLWGRLGYDPEVPNSKFAQLINERFQIENGQDLLSIWQHASVIYPITTGFHWGALDFQWYIEACKSRPGPARTESGFHDVNRFISLPPHPASPYMSIPSYIEKMPNIPKDSISPLQVTSLLNGHVDQVFDMIDSFKADTLSELSRTLLDIETMAYLGRYYAYKIEGATYLGIYRDTDAPETKEKAVNALKNARDAWKLYTENAKRAYINPWWTNRVGYIDWDMLSKEVAKDIFIAGQD